MLYLQGHYVVSISEPVRLQEIEKRLKKNDNRKGFLTNSARFR